MMLCVKESKPLRQGDIIVHVFHVLSTHLESILKILVHGEKDMIYSLDLKERNRKILGYSTTQLEVVVKGVLASAVLEKSNNFRTYQSGVGCTRGGGAG